MIYFISDLHFSHDKEFVYKARGFESVEEMGNAIIDNINSVVGRDDTLYILGDVYLGSGEGIEYFKRINCNDIHLILGNHDSPKKVKALSTAKEITSVLYADMVKWGKFYFYISHFPTITATTTRHLSTTIINLFGHTHQTEKFYINDKEESIPWMYNIGCDAHNCMPVSITQIIDDMRKEFAAYSLSQQRKEAQNGNIRNE